MNYEQDHYCRANCDYSYYLSNLKVPYLPYSVQIGYPKAEAF